jgi:hypothetical protein
MSSFQELDQILISVKWHSDLAAIIQEYLNTSPRTHLTIDSLLSATTKLVENNLREAIEDFTKATVPRERGYGVELLNYGKTVGFVPETRRAGECVFSLIYWYFEKPRNTTHHSFTHFPLSTILAIVSITNYILDEIDNLKTKHEFYDAKMRIIYNPSPLSLSVTVKDIEKDGEPINPLGLEMIFVNPDKSMQHYPLIHQGDSWNIKTSPHISMAGTCRIDFVGFKQNNERFTITGSSLVVVT